MQLTATAVGHRFGAGPWLFRDLDLALVPGEVVAITGPSGTGKSTLLSILAGDLRPAEGIVDRAYVTRQAKVAQSPHGVRQRAALDHLVLPYLAAGYRRVAAEQRALPLAERFGLTERITAPYGQLSGGEAQRLMLARAVAEDAQLILADEPTASLDAGNARTVIGVLGQLTSRGAMVVVATHDPRARDACDRVLDLGDQSLRSA